MALLAGPVNAAQWPVFCDFANKWNTYNGDIGNLDTGQPWVVLTYSNGMVPTQHGNIRDGALISDDMSTVYATQTLPFIPARMGAMISFLPGNASIMPGSVTMAISKDNRFISVMGAHLSVTPSNWLFYVRDENGFDLVAQGKIDPPMAIDGTQYLIEYSVIGNAITLSINGKRYAYSNPRISPNLGQFCFWEVYHYNKTETSAKPQFNKVWAGAAIATVAEGSLVELQ